MINVSDFTVNYLDAKTSLEFDGLREEEGSMFVVLVC